MGFFYVDMYSLRWKQINGKNLNISWFGFPSCHFLLIYLPENLYDKLLKFWYEEAKFLEFILQ